MLPDNHRRSSGEGGSAQKKELDDLFLDWGQASLSPVSTGALVADTHRNSHTHSDNTDRTNGRKTHHLKTSHLETNCELID